MKKSNFLFFPILLFVSCVQLSNSDSKDGNGGSQVVLKSNFHNEDEFYSIFEVENLHSELAIARPSKSDTSIQLCIPAAFTQLANDSVDGLFIIDGKIINGKVNHHLGGGLLIANNRISVLKMVDGKILDEQWIDSIVHLKQTFFQQIQLVRNDSALELRKDQKLFQRRAIAIFENGDVAIVESKNEITLQEFADDLVKMRVKNAIYTDMGSFDEGWYRNQANKKTIKMGMNCSQTSEQSNWLVFKRE